MSTSTYAPTSSRSARGMTSTIASTTTNHDGLTGLIDIAMAPSTIWNSSESGFQTVVTSVAMANAEKAMRPRPTSTTQLSSTNTTRGDIPHDTISIGTFVIMVVGIVIAWLIGIVACCCLRETKKEKAHRLQVEHRVLQGRDTVVR
jgi:ABC-type phosphate transport system permease subunit